MLAPSCDGLDRLVCMPSAQRQEPEGSRSDLCQSASAPICELDVEVLTGHPVMRNLNADVASQLAVISQLTQLLDQALHVRH